MNSFCWCIYVPLLLLYMHNYVIVPLMFYNWFSTVSSSLGLMTVNSDIPETCFRVSSQSLLNCLFIFTRSMIYVVLLPLCNDLRNFLVMQRWSIWFSFSVVIWWYPRHLVNSLVWKDALYTFFFNAYELRYIPRHYRSYLQFHVFPLLTSPILALKFPMRMLTSLWALVQDTL